MEAVVKSKRVSSSSLRRASSPASRCEDEDSGESGSTEEDRRGRGDEADDRPASSRGWQATDSRLCWKSSSRTWTARRSAGSPLGELSPSNNKFPANNFSRSMSYDRLAANYLSGQWPRAFHLPYDRLDALPRHGTALTADKWTQTDSNEYNTSSKMRICAKSLCLTSSNGGGRNPNFVERKLASRLLESDLLICDSHDGHEPLHNGGLSCSKNRRGAFIDAGHRKILTSSQGSDEGFNQEVEKLIQCTGVLEPGQIKSVEVMVPDGHRAPIAELLSMGCPNGRILSRCPNVHSDLENYFVRIISDDAPDGTLMPPPLLLSAVVDRTAVPFHRSSSARKTSGFCQRPKNVIISPCPVVCRSSCSREAPDGSEVEDKLTFDVRPSVVCSSTSVPSKLKALKRYAIPSERSAFCPLSKKCVGRKLPLTLSLSPSTKGDGIQ